MIHANSNSFLSPATSTLRSNILTTRAAFHLWKKIRFKKEKKGECKIHKRKKQRENNTIPEYRGSLSTTRKNGYHTDKGVHKLYTKIGEGVQVIKTTKVAALSQRQKQYSSENNHGIKTGENSIDVKLCDTWINFVIKYWSKGVNADWTQAWKAKGPWKYTNF